jgi:hypothetical protein
MVLLAAVVGYPDIGPTFFTSLYSAAQANPGHAWVNWLTTHQHAPLPVPADSADAGTAHQRKPDRLVRLTTTLLHVGDVAATAGLALPRRLDAWAAWVIPVGRLSFPTGPAVTQLMNLPHHRPRPATWT